jgi:2-polyprenyl-3-methyl-5-hydroxy-6-metoxy-1,4-benzoquinol methylase
MANIKIFSPPIKTCIACGSPEISVWDKREKDGIKWSILKCKTCGCGFLNPRPTREWLETIYSKSGHGLTAPISFDEVLAAEREYPNATVDAARLVGRAKELLPEEKEGLTALDIGSGYGFFTAAALRAGFSVTAINPSVWENNIFQQMNGFRPIEAFFEDVDFTQQFDLVILSQVLEHIENPLGMLSRVRSILSPQGIVAIAVPNFDSYWVKIFKRDGGVIWVPEHLNCFSKKSLTMLLSRAGFDVVRYQAISRFPYFYLSNRFHLKGLPRIISNHFVKLGQDIPHRIVISVGLGGGSQCLGKTAIEFRTRANMNDKTISGNIKIQEFECFY